MIGVNRHQLNTKLCACDCFLLLLLVGSLTPMVFRYESWAKLSLSCSGLDQGWFRVPALSKQEEEDEWITIPHYRVYKKWNNMMLPGTQETWVYNQQSLSGVVGFIHEEKNLFLFVEVESDQAERFLNNSYINTITRKCMAHIHVSLFLLYLLWDVASFPPSYTRLESNSTALLPSFANI